MSQNAGLAGLPGGTAQTAHSKTSATPNTHGKVTDKAKGFAALLHAGSQKTAADGSKATVHTQGHGQKKPEAAIDLAARGKAEIKASGTQKKADPRASQGAPAADGAASIAAQISADATPPQSRVPLSHGDASLAVSDATRGKRPMALAPQTAANSKLAAIDRAEQAAHRAKPSQQATGPGPAPLTPNQQASLARTKPAPQAQDSPAPLELRHPAINAPQLRVDDSAARSGTLPGAFGPLVNQSAQEPPGPAPSTDALLARTQIPARQQVGTDVRTLFDESSLRISDSGNGVTVRLRPPLVGDVSIELVQREADPARVVLVFASRQSAALAANDLPMLQRLLTAAGGFAEDGQVDIEIWHKDGAAAQHGGSDDARHFHNEGGQGKAPEWPLRGQPLPTNALDIDSLDDTNRLNEWA